MKKLIIFLCLLFISIVTLTLPEGSDPLSDTSHGSTSKKDSSDKAPSIIESTVVSRESRIIKAPPSQGTPSGLAPLEKISYAHVDISFVEALPEKKISHSHGPASGGKAHHSVIEFQKLFNKYNACTLDTSGKKVLYLTFDCGYEYDNLTSRVLDVLEEKNVPAAFFCTLDHLKKEPEIISRMIKQGHIVGNHSATHPGFADISVSQMIKEIEETENYLRESFGYAAKYFRFPKGEYNERSLATVEALGYMSVFWSVAYDDWNVENIRGKDYAVEKIMSRLHSGAVILLHSVSRDNADALGEIIDKARQQGYEFLSLENLG